MNSEWEEVRLGEISEVITKGTTPTTVGYRFEDQGINFVKSESITFDGRIDSSKFAFIDDEAHAALKRSQLKEGDLLFSMAGVYIGKTAVVPKAILPANTNQAVGIVRLLQGRALPRFVDYYLRNPVYNRYLNNLVSQSAQPNLNLGEIRNLPISLPPLAEQELIAEALCILDDRITLLRETSATLDAIIEALFKSWFVDFDPVCAKRDVRAPEGLDEAIAELFPDSFEESELGLVPRGWKVQPVGDVVDTVGGATPDTKEPAFWEPAEFCWTTPKDLAGIHVPVLLATERKLSARGLAKIGSGLLPQGTLLLSSRAPIGYLAVAQTPLAINQGYIAMPPGSTLPPLYMLFWCRRNMEGIKARANGSTFMEISKKAFRPIPILVPPDSVIQVFTDVAAALFERLVENEKQAKTLAEMRDALLPRLISGQLRLPEAKELFA